MTNVSVHDFQREVSCFYCGDEYLVRDNGAVLRKKRPGRRRRPLDEKWTFGNPCRHSGYMKLSDVVVHRIMATVFHGKQPSERHVVDHIDTNRRNNRAENLRWVTRLENILLNEATHKKIVAAYGSFAAFFKNPERPEISRLLGQYDWMRTVSKQEALASRKRMEKWAKSDKRLRGGSFGEWLFAADNPVPKREFEVQDVDSLTTGAIQRRWKTPCEFPACPDEAKDDALLQYKCQLTSEAIYSRNEYGERRAVSAEISQDNSSLIVLCKLLSNAIKPWANSRVTIENGIFCHDNLGSCFTLEGAKKRHCLAQGLPWEGGDSIDDYT